MFPFQWLASLKDKLRAPQFRNSKTQRKQHRRYQSPFAQTSIFQNVAESLEDRTMLTAFTVLNTNDSGTGSLREAIEQANNNAGADTISFDASLAGQSIVLTEEILISDDLTITGLGADQLTLDGDGNSRIFNITDNFFDSLLMVEIRGLSLINGYSNNGGGIRNSENLTVIDCTFFANNVSNPQIDNASIYNGGGIQNYRGNLTVSGSRFDRNSAIDGGGIYNVYGDVNVMDCTFTENLATTTQGQGGALYSLYGTLNVSKSVFFKNSSVSGSGGGINSHSNTLHVTDSTFTENSADFGGGAIRNTRGSLAFGSMFISNCVFSKNYTATYAVASGGAIYVSTVGNRDYTTSIIECDFVENSSYLGGGIYVQGYTTINGCNFLKNSAAGSGGGISAIGNETVTVINSSLENNSAWMGGGIYSSAALSVLNSTFLSNSITYGGGAIYNSFGTVSIINSTLSGNYATSSENLVAYGGAIFNQGLLDFGFLHVTNSTITGNSASYSGGGIYSEYDTVSLTNSILAGNTARIDAQINSKYTNNSSIIQDSVLGLIDRVLRNNGGPKKTHALLPGSAALNAGDNTAVINAELSTDQRGTGFARIVDGTVDIGAFEVQGPFTQINLRVVNSRTDTESNGEANTLPDNLTWINEWGGYWLEIWVSTPYTTDFSILSAALNLSYNTAITTATSIEYGAAFTENQTGTINDLTGTIENLSAETTLTNAGDDQRVLFARIRFESTIDDAVDLDLDGQSLNSQIPGLEINHPEILFTGNAVSEEIHGPAPETQIYANPYDLNDDDVINFRDLMLFASVYNTIPGDSDSDYSWFADYNQDGRVGFRDLILFASNYQKSKANQSTINYAPNFPGDWNQLLTVETQLPPKTKAKSVTQSAAETVLESVVEQVSPQLTPDQNETLNNVDVQVVDLEDGILGRAVPGTIYIDVNAAGHGWFVDSTPGDHSEFTFSSELTLIALESTEAAAGVDLWTVILHELGHLLGHEHEAEGVMQETLAPGVRKLSDWEEDSDQFFIELTDDSNLITF